LVSRRGGKPSFGDPHAGPPAARTSREAGEPRSTWTVMNGPRMHARVAEGAVTRGQPGGGLGARAGREAAPRPGRVRAVGCPGLLDARNGPEDAALVGNSPGCQGVADLAVRHPRHVGRAVLQGRRWTPRRVPLLGRRRGCCSTVPANRLPRRRYAARLPGRGVLSGDAHYSLRPGGPCRGQAARDGDTDTRRARLARPHGAATMGRSSDRPPARGRLVMLPGAAHAADYGSPSEFAWVVRAPLDGNREASEKAR
jgi:hypothetical protein